MRKILSFLITSFILCLNMQAQSIDSIVFSWLGSTYNQSFSLQVTAGTHSIKVDWGDSTSSTYSTSGSTNISPFKIYENIGTYNVTLSVSDTNTHFLNLNLNNANVSDLNIGSATKLQNLSCHSNLLENLDVSKNIELSVLHCYNNKLENLDVTRNTALQSIFCNNNRLKTLELSQNNRLSTIHCHNNHLESLTISNKLRLIELNCSENQLTVLDVSGATALHRLYCTNNQLLHLDLSKNTSLTNLTCHSNALPLSDLYVASKQVMFFNNKRLGTQNHALQKALIDTAVSLSGEMILGGVPAHFNVTRNNNPAIAGVDYNLDYTSETITFLSAGEFEVTLSHDSIFSQPSYPAEVIMPFTVISGLYDAEIISVTAPISGTDLTATEMVKVMIRNNSASRPITGFNLTLSINGIFLANEPFSDSIAPSSEVEYTFHSNIDLSAEGEHHVQVSVNLEGDIIPENDTLSITITNTICNAITHFPWTENFDDQTALTCWYIVDADHSIPSWEWNSGILYHDAYFETYQTGWLISPPIVLPTEEELLLSFFSINSDVNYYGKNSVLISTGSDDPTSGDFTEIWSPSSVSESWTETIINLSAYKGQTIYVAFKYEGHFAHTWYLDDVSIGDTLSRPELSTDATLAELIINKGILTPPFSSTNTSYFVTVPYEVTNITITGIANDFNASVKGNITSVALKEGDNSFTIEVIAQDSTVKMFYTIIVTREKEGVGITDLNPKRVTVYPNPAIEVINIQSEELINTIALYELSGKQIFAKAGINNQEYKINLTGLINGYYLLKVNEEVVKIGKIRN